MRVSVSPGIEVLPFRVYIVAYIATCLKHLRDMMFKVKEQFTLSYQYFRYITD